MSAIVSAPTPTPARAPVGVTILGSTGSIGVSTLNVIALHPERYRVVALTAYRQVDRLFEQCRQFRPDKAVMVDAAAAQSLRAKLKAADLRVEVLSGVEGLNTVVAAAPTRVVMAAIVGAAGLIPTLTALRSGKRVLLANKEPMVMAGRLCMSEAQRSGAEILPIDSEHNAIFQCMPRERGADLAQVGVRKILLTCSGGPFLHTAAADLAQVTPAQAIAHPNWSMGRKISVDSATLMNKGLEVIEACRLFDATPDQVEVVIHPQSVIHSLVEYVDGSVLAQLGNPDMRTPIAHALAWPERIGSGVKSLDLVEIGRLDFARPDQTRFPCLRLAYTAARVGGTAPAILNAANEVAVQAFLDGRIAFTAIARTIEHCLGAITPTADLQLESILAHDAAARTAAENYIAADSRTML